MRKQGALDFPVLLLVGEYPNYPHEFFESCAKKLNRKVCSGLNADDCLSNSVFDRDRFGRPVRNKEGRTTYIKQRLVCESLENLDYDYILLLSDALFKLEVFTEDRVQEFFEILKELFFEHKLTLLPDQIKEIPHLLYTVFPIVPKLYEANKAYFDQFPNVLVFKYTPDSDEYYGNRKEYYTTLIEGLEKENEKYPDQELSDIIKARKFELKFLEYLKNRPEFPTLFESKDNSPSIGEPGSFFADYKSFPKDQITIEGVNTVFNTIVSDGTKYLNDLYNYAYGKKERDVDFALGQNKAILLYTIYMDFLKEEGMIK